MGRLKALLRYLWNGGPEEGASPAELRQRRLLGTTVFLLLPVALILIIANIWLFYDVADNKPILAAMGLVVFSLFLRARFGWHTVASYVAIAAFWVVPTYLIYESGLNTSNWAWMFPIVLLAQLLGNTKTALTWTAICIGTLLAFSLLTQSGVMTLAVRPEFHAKAVAISGSLILVMLFLAGFAFRHSQQVTEVQLKEHIERLAREVETRRQAEEAARNAERSQAVFLATVSHELRTPLNGVIGAGQLLRETALTTEQTEFVDVVTSSGEMLLALINDVLDLSKLEAGKVELDLAPMEISSVVSVTLAPMVLLGRKKEVSVSCEIDERVPPVIVGDATRFSQILLNLVGNALKFTDQGHVKVILSCEPESERLLLTIEDTGIGIPEEARSRLFQPFTQAESSTTRRFGGTGLGLTIVAQIVERMHGDIKIESEVGKGTRLNLSFPLVLPTAEMSQAFDTLRGLEPVVEVGELKVLITDDNAVNRLVATRMLRQMRHEVYEANDGIEAVELIQAEDFDLVLMDVQMPNMDGLTATKKIRELPGKKGRTPIIGLTANAMASDKAELIEIGMDGYLAKPVRKELLQASIWEVLKT